MTRHKDGYTAPKQSDKTTLVECSVCLRRTAVINTRELRNVKDPETGKMVKAITLRKSPIECGLPDCKPRA